MQPRIKNYYLTLHQKGEMPQIKTPFGLLFEVVRTGSISNGTNMSLIMGCAALTGTADCLTGFLRQNLTKIEE